MACSARPEKTLRDHARSSKVRPCAPQPSTITRLASSIPDVLLQHRCFKAVEDLGFILRSRNVLHPRGSIAAVKRPRSIIVAIRFTTLKVQSFAIFNSVCPIAGSFYKHSDTSNSHCPRPDEVEDKTKAISSHSHSRSQANSHTSPATLPPYLGIVDKPR